MINNETNLSLSKYLRVETKEYHTLAEGSPFVTNLLAGSLDIKHYYCYLSGILPLYQSLECYLEKNQHENTVKQLYLPFLFRAGSLISDIHELEKDINVSEECITHPVLPIETLEQCVGVFYTRYFGDLMGGQIIKKKLIRKYSLTQKKLSFYDFDFNSNLRSSNIIKELRCRLDRINFSRNEVAEVVKASKDTFLETIKVMSTAMKLNTHQN